MSKPVLLRLELRSGKPIDGARVQYEAPEIPGFLAIESKEYSNATQYISLNEITSFTTLNEEVCNVTSCIPVATIKAKVRQDNSI